MKPHHLTHRISAVCLAAFALTATVKAQQTVIQVDHTWNYLHPMGALPPRPDTTPDPDFEATWFLAEPDFVTTYDGPSFTANTDGNPAVLDSADSGPGQGPFAYGTVDVIAPTTALTLPDTNNRFSSYFRTTFTVPAGGLIEPTIRIACDDGGFIYLDGTLIATVNITDGVTDTYTSFASDADSTEVDPAGLFTFHLRSAGVQPGAMPGDVNVLVPVPSLTAGVHTLAISVHNNAATSSDMGLQLELMALDATTTTLHPVVSNAVRNDQGTPGNVSDDTFTFDVSITGSNTSAAWNSDAIPATGSYGVVTTMGPFSAVSPAIVVFTDSVNPAGTATVTVPAPAPAFVNLVNYNHTWKVMNPQGGVIPPDADFETTWFLKESDFATQYNGPNFGADGVAGSYEAVTGPGPFQVGGITGIAANQPVGAAGTTLTLPASGNRKTSYYRTTFTTTQPMSVLNFEVLCDDGVYIYLDGNLVAQENMTAAPGFNSVAANARNENTITPIDLSQPPGGNVIGTVAGLPAGEHTLAVSLHQAAFDSSDFGIALKLAGIEVIGQTIIQAAAGPAIRNNAGTPLVPGDDTFTFEVTVTGSNGGANWTSDSIPASGNYGVATVFGPFPVSGGSKTVIVAAASDPTVTASVTVVPPASTMTAAVSNVTRDGNGTPTDPRDDTFSFQVTADGAFLSGSWDSNQTAPPSGSYGVPVVFGPFPIASSPLTATLTDSQVTTATASVTVYTPRYTPLIEIVPYSQTWSVMNPITGVMPDGPGGPDADFETTWYLAEESFTTIYNGPTFGSGGTAAYQAISGPAPFAVGGVDGIGAVTTIGPVGTAITLPPTDQRFTSYYRTTFTTSENIDSLKFDVLCDDGIFIYLDGVLVARHNITVDDTFMSFAANGAEQEIATIDMAAAPGGDVVVSTPSLAAGNHTLAVSLHQTNATSSDAGFALTLHGRPATGVSINAVVGTVTRNFNNSLTPTDDTFNFPVTVTAVNGGANWNSNAVPATGSYGVETLFGPLPVSQAPKRIVFSDSGDPLAISPGVAALPAIFGLKNFNGTLSPVLPALPIPANWTANPSNISHSSNVGVAAPGSVISSEVVDLSGATGPVQFRMNLNASDTSAGSNFDDTDTVLVELVLNDGLAEQRINLITPFDTNANGLLNGFSGADTAAYNAGKAADELNGAQVDAQASANHTFALGHVIPDNITSAQVVVTVVDLGGTESVTLSGVTFTPSTAIVDSDGDGQSDPSEALAGTNPNDPSDYLRVTAISPAGAGANVTFPSKIGINYTAEVSETVEAGWVAFGNPIAGTGAPITVNLPQVPLPGENKYFLRIRVIP
jgi:hypothetical protein